jgi:hypothetical protein
MSEIDSNPEANYTQRTVAWPTLLYDTKRAGFEDIHIDLGDKAPHEAGAMFVFHEYGIKVEAFDDALRTLLDPRVQRVLLSLDAKRLERVANGDRGNEPAVSPAGLIRILEREGFVASTYHRKGSR